MKNKVTNKLTKLKNILPIIFYIGIGVIYGYFTSSFLDSKLGEAVSLETYFIVLIFLIALLYLSITIQVVIHELGHLIFGLISGYKFTSFRLLNIMLIKISGKYKIKFFSLPGTAGQCLMTPPELKNNTIPYALYNLGGSVLNLVTVPLFSCMYFIFRDVMELPIIFIVLAVSGLALGVMNIIPISFAEMDNDGTNFVTLYKNPDAIKALYIQCSVNAELAKGTRLKDMPKKWFYMPEDKFLNNSLSSAVAVLYADRLFEEEEFEKAEIIIDKLLSKKNSVAMIHRRLLICNKIFCLLIKGNFEETVKYLDTEQTVFMKRMKNFPSVIRTNFAIELLNNKNSNAAEVVLKKFEKIAKSYPYTAEIESERELIEIIKSR